MSGFFISHSKYMLLNAASECFLMIFVSTKEWKNLKNKAVQQQLAWTQLHKNF